MGGINECMLCLLGMVLVVVLYRLIVEIFIGGK